MSDFLMDNAIDGLVNKTVEDVVLCLDDLGSVVMRVNYRMKKNNASDIYDKFYSLFYDVFDADVESDPLVFSKVNSIIADSKEKHFMILRKANGSDYTIDDLRAVYRPAEPIK